MPYLFLIIFIYIFFSSNILFSNEDNSSIEKLEKLFYERIEQRKFDSLFFKYSEDLFIYYSQTSPLKAIQKFNYLLSIPEFFSNSINKALIFHYISNTFRILNRQDLAIKYLIESSIYFEKNNKYLEKFFNYSEIGNVYYSINLYNEALNYYFQGIRGLEIYKDQIVDSLRLNHLKAVLNSNIGLCYANLGEYKNAIEYYHKAFQYSTPYKNFMRDKLQYFYLGNSFLAQGIADSSIFYLNKSLNTHIPILENIFFDVEIDKFNSFAYQSLLKNFLKLNLKDSLNYYFNKSYKAIKDNLPDLLKIRHLILLSEIFIYNDYDLSLKLLSEAFQLSKDFDIPIHLLDIYKNFANLYSLKGNYKKSNEFLNLYLQLNEENQKNKLINSFEITKAAEKLNFQIN